MRTPPFDAPQRILVVCLRYLGDSLLLRPVFRALRERYPESRIDALVGSGTGIALEGCEDLDGVLEWPKRSPLAALGMTVRIRRGRYDWVVDFTNNDRSALLAWLSGAGLRVAYDRPRLPSWTLRRAAYNFRPPPKVRKPHTVIQRLELLEACGVPPARRAIELKIDPEAREAMARATAHLPEAILHLHVTSRDMQKAVPAGIIIGVVQEALRRQLAVVVTTGSAEHEREYVRAALAGIDSPNLCTLSGLRWGELVALIARCRLYFGCDTAPMHVASTLRKPMLALFGPSKVDHWRPLHPAGRVLVAECRCLRQKRIDCPAGQPGACLGAVSGREVCEALFGLLDEEG